MKDLTWFFVCNLIVDWLLGYFVYQLGENIHILLILAVLGIIDGLLPRPKLKPEKSRHDNYHRHR